MARPTDGPLSRALFTSFLHRVKDSAAIVDKIFEDIALYNVRSTSVHGRIQMSETCRDNIEHYRSFCSSALELVTALATVLQEMLRRLQIQPEQATDSPTSFILDKTQRSIEDKQFAADNTGYIIARLEALLRVSSDHHKIVNAVRKRQQHEFEAQGDDK
ncbi:hypothetical protein IQ06DRAFT_343918 [Phaeosphaeriaceae sp. SRC1lsM3a]|nr:hypothetical protein IQ06DRAFT_343918 [Stagonospora sp. SRC1lsM3a]